MALNDEEKKPLLGDSTFKEDEKIVDANSHGVHGNIQESSSDQSWFQKNKQRIPGYGLLSLWKQASLYMMYVLLILLLVYLMNQLNRFTISITAKYVGADLGFGEKACIPNVTYIKAVLREDNSSYSRHNLIKHYYPECAKSDANASVCEAFLIVIGGINETACCWGYDGSLGTKYQVLAGAAFNNIYPITGLFMGILADRFNRKILLGICLLFWSLATGATGFATSYWMIVIFRLLLAVGTAGCTPFAISIISDYFPQNLRGTAVSIYYFGIYTGYSLSYAIGNFVNISLGWRWVFFISGLFGIALTPIVIFTIKEPERNKDSNDDKKVAEILNSKDKFHEFLNKMKLLAKTFILPGMLMLCIAGGVRNAGGYVWGYNTQPFFQSKGYSDTYIASFMTFIPLVAGSFGAILGGVISDFLVKGRGAVARIWVLMASQLLAAPFAAGALFLPKPWCFLSLIPSNVIGEMWVGVASATIVDLAPTVIRTSSIALYIFIITVIGGNFNIVVPQLQKVFKHYMHGSKKAVDRNSLRWALFLTFPAIYVISSFLFLLAFLLMRIDKKVKARCNEQVPLNNNNHKVESGEEEEKVTE